MNLFCCAAARAIGLGGLFVVILLFVITCGEAPPVDPGPPDQTYSLRGKVVSLPNERQKEISIYHEAVPDFVSADGEVVGMDGMTMPFAVALGEDLSGIEKGDKIAFELEVRWEGDEVITARQIKKLPAETLLDFEQPKITEPTDEPADAADAESGSDHAGHATTSP